MLNGKAEEVFYFLYIFRPILTKSKNPKMLFTKKERERQMFTKTNKEWNKEACLERVINNVKKPGKMDQHNFMFVLRKETECLVYVSLFIILYVK